MPVSGEFRHIQSDVPQIPLFLNVLIDQFADRGSAKSRTPSLFQINKSTLEVASNDEINEERPLLAETLLHEIRAFFECGRTCRFNTHAIRELDPVQVRIG